MKSRLVVLIVSTVLLSAAMVAAPAEGVSQQPVNQGMYVSVLWTPMVIGDGLPAKVKHDVSGVFDFPFGFGGSVGYQFNRYVAAEIIGWTAITNFYNAAIAAKLMLPLGNVADLYTKLGAGVLNYKDVFNNTQSGGGPFFALGLGFRLTPRLELNVEATTYMWVRENDFFNAVGTGGLGLTYHF